jgi:mRNA guanylyltransferase
MASVDFHSNPHHNHNNHFKTATMGSSVTLDDVGERIPHEDMQFHRGTIADLLGRQQLSFPGAQPVSFARQHFSELQKTDYYLCEKTDGIRCLLYLTAFLGTDEGDIEAQFLIDRKNEYYYIPRNSLHLPTQGSLESYHTGTLLDGELVRQDCGNGQSKLVYLIFDGLCLDGQAITNRQLDIRLGKIRAFVYEPWLKLMARYPQEAEHQPFQLQLKRMEVPYAAEMMFRDILPKLPHGNDGLIFTCKSTPYVAGTDVHILKWKPPHENTIDFKLQLVAFPTDEDEDGVYEDWDAKPEIDLLVNHGDREGYQRFANLALTDDEWEAIKTMGEQIDGRIIECFRDPATGSWRPKIEKDGTPRYRDDKKDANHISTVRSVIESIQDGVTEQDLIVNSSKIRDAWKKREAEAKIRREQEKRRAYEAEQNKRSQAEAQRQRQQVIEQDEDDAPKYDD